jgi:hypothetical protein
MEPESLLLSSQKPATCPYAELDQSSQRSRPMSLMSPLILYSQLRLGFPTGLPLRRVSPTKTCMQLSYLQYVIITKRERVYCAVRI